MLISILVYHFAFVLILILTSLVGLSHAIFLPGWRCWRQHWVANKVRCGKHPEMQSVRWRTQTHFAEMTFGPLSHAKQPSPCRQVHGLIWHFFVWVWFGEFSCVIIGVCLPCDQPRFVCDPWKWDLSQPWRWKDIDWSWSISCLSVFLVIFFSCKKKETHWKTHFFFDISLPSRTKKKRHNGWPHLPPWNRFWKQAFPGLALWKVKSFLSTAWHHMRAPLRRHRRPK